MANNLLELLDTWAAHKPYQTGYRFLPRGPGEATTISYQQLTERICDVASRLRQTAEPGSRVLVAATSTIDFVLTLLGTLWAGMIAVPLSPSYFLGRRKGLAQIVANCEPSIAVSPYPRLSPTALDLISGTTLLQTSDLVSRGAAKRSSLSWRPDERLAILQYTSGSTAAPRGVRITHANILSNAWSMAQLYRLGPETVGVNWTPLYHDMGLMAGVFVPLVCGYESILLSPESVVAEPLRWLAAISEHGGTISGGPNFAYDLCLERIDDAASHGLQLRSWMVAFTGAENVRAETLNRFADRFSKWGFRRQAFYPCYRLAEATVFVCGKSLGSGSDVIEVDRESLQLSGIAEPAVLARPAVRFVNHGEPPADTEVVIVDPKRLTCRSEGQIGEIWVRGPSVGDGYWNKQDESRQVFSAFISDTNDGPFLRTGDMGFQCNKQLCIVGRIKDTILIRGVNHSAWEIEASVEESHTALLRHRGVAVSIEIDGREHWWWCKSLVAPSDRNRLWF